MKPPLDDRVNQTKGSADDFLESALKGSKDIGPKSEQLKKDIMDIISKSEAIKPRIVSTAKKEAIDKATNRVKKAFQEDVMAAQEVIQNPHDKKAIENLKEKTLKLKDALDSLNDVSTPSLNDCFEKLGDVLDKIPLQKANDLSEIDDLVSYIKNSAHYAQAVKGDDKEKDKLKEELEDFDDIFNELIKGIKGGEDQNKIEKKNSRFKTTYRKIS